MAAEERARDALRDALDMPFVNPALVEGTTGPSALWTVDNVMARAVAGAFEARLRLDDFRAGAYGGASRLDGDGAPASLRAALPTRWAGIGRVELRYDAGWFVAVCWGWDADERERARRFTRSLLTAARAWAREAPRLWTRGPAPRAARETVEEELGWLSPDVVEGDGGLRARLLLDEGGGLAGELQMDGAALTLDAKLPPGLPPLTLEREAPGFRGWWARRGELRTGERALDEAWLIDGPPEAAPLLRSLRDPLLELHARGGRLVVEERLRLSAAVEPELRLALRASAGLWRSLALRALGLPSA